MNTIKIASKFLTRAQASKQATKERQLLKVQGKFKTHRVEVLFAYNLWRTNKWFNQKKFGLMNPTDQDYIVIITEIKQPSSIVSLTPTRTQIKASTHSGTTIKNKTSVNPRVKKTPANKTQMPLFFIPSSDIQLISVLRGHNICLKSCLYHWLT